MFSTALAALLNGQGGVLDEPGLQPGEVLLLRPHRPPVGEKAADHPLQQADEGGEHHHRGQAEEGVQQGDVHGGENGLQEGEVDGGVDGIEHSPPDHHPQHVNEEVDEGSALAVDVGPQGGQEHRQGGPDGDAHGEGIGHGKGDDPCGGQGLKNAHRRRGALEHAGEDHPHQDAQQGVGKGGQQVQEGLGSPGGETEALMVCMPNMSTANPSKMSPTCCFPLAAGEHPQEDAHHRHHPGEGGGGQKGHPAGPALQVETGR